MKKLTLEHHKKIAQRLLQARKIIGSLIPTHDVEWCGFMRAKDCDDLLRLEQKIDVMLSHFEDVMFRDHGTNIDPDFKINHSPECENNGIPAQAITMLAPAKLGTIIKLEDGSEYMKVFTKNSERIIQVKCHSEEVLKITEAHQFSIKFSYEFDRAEVPSAQRDKISDCAIQILRFQGDPTQANLNVIQLAISAAIDGGKKFDDSLRYAKNVEAFGSLEKALVAASI